MSDAYEGSDGRVVVHEDHLEVVSRRGTRRVETAEVHGSDFLRPGRFSAGSFTVQTVEGFAPSGEDRLHTVGVGPEHVARFEELEHRLSAVAATRPAAPGDQAPEVPLHTLHEVPGRTSVASLGMVTGISVVSRNALSDYGSELKSAFGGELGGEQQAYARSLGAAVLRIRQRAAHVGADQVVAVAVAVQATAGGGQAVVVTGTAVRTVAAGVRAGQDAGGDHGRVTGEPRA